MLLLARILSVAVYETGATRKAKSRIVLMDWSIFARAGFIVIVAVAVFMFVLVGTGCAGKRLAVGAEYGRAPAGAAQATAAEHYADGHHRHSEAESDKDDYENREHTDIVPRSWATDQVN